MCLEELQFKFEINSNLDRDLNLGPRELYPGALSLVLSWFNWRYRSILLSWKQCYARLCDLWQYHHLIGQVTSSVFIYSDILNQLISKYKHYLCLEELQFKFKRLDIWKSEVQIPVQIRIFFLNLNIRIYSLLNNFHKLYLQFMSGEYYYNTLIHGKVACQMGRLFEKASGAALVQRNEWKVLENQLKGNNKLWS